MLQPLPNYSAVGQTPSAGAPILVPLTRKDTANILRCSERKVDRLLRANLLESTRDGRSVLISPRSVAALIPRT